MAEKWTNTSSPFSRWMNPKPFPALNHFTVPVSFMLLSLFSGLFLAIKVLTSGLRAVRRRGTRGLRGAPLAGSNGRASVSKAPNNIAHLKLTCSIGVSFDDGGPLAYARGYRGGATIHKQFGGCMLAPRVSEGTSLLRNPGTKAHSQPRFVGCPSRQKRQRHR